MSLSYLLVISPTVPRGPPPKPSVCFLIGKKGQLGPQQWNNACKQQVLHTCLSGGP